MGRPLRLPYIRLGETVSMLRRQRNISQEELAFVANIDRTYVSRIERGKANPSFHILTKLARTLHVSVELLIHGK